MKIIKKGKVPTKEKKVTCFNCKTIFTYTPKDVKGGDRDGYYVNCPVCKQFIDRGSK